MRATFCIVIFALIAPCMRAQTNLTELLQQGMLEEQANHNIDAAISDYEALSTQFDKDRQLAATAIFRLGECYREEGLTNQAAVEYRRILSEFPDQKTLAMLSQQDLAGMGAESSTKLENAATAPSQTSVQPNDEDQEIARLQAMIQNSPDLINAPDDKERTPLGNAAAKGQLKVAAFLLDHGADINRVTRGGSPLFWAADAAQRTMVRFLLDHGADVNAGEGEALDAAIKRGYKAVAETLLNARANVNVRDDNGQTPLDLAAADGRTEMIQMLLDSGADPNIPDNWGGTPLIRATRLGGGQVIENLKLLLAAKADPNAGRCDLPLLCAINNRDVKAADLLLQAGANPNAKSLVTPNLGNLISGFGRVDNFTPLWAAVSMHNAPIVQLLLKYKADPNDIQINNTPVIFSAVDKTNVLKALLNAGANPNVTDDEGRTPLSFAAQDASPTAVALLLAAGADPNAGTCDAPLLCAINNDDTTTADLLLQAGANPNVNGLIRGSFKNFHSDGFYTPLWTAVCMNRLPIVQLLLKYKANPDAQTSELPAAIFWVLSNTNILQALLDGGANPNVRNGDGKTPLALAEEMESGTVYVGNDSFAPPDQQKIIAASIADLLRQHGALEVLPDWDHITVRSPSGKNSFPVFNKGTNDWNRFTLFEFLYHTWARSQFGMYFADFAHITIVRPGATGETSKRIPISVLNSTNGVDCSQDVPLEFGDIVEIPKREHTLAEEDTQIDTFIREMISCLRNKAGTAKLIVDGGQTVQLPLNGFEPVDSYLPYVLDSNIARNVLTSESDLSRVKVTRGEKTWIVNCANRNYDRSDLWMRDGDVIEVPETQ
ncbi:MAG TPA: ankyrin repeat domain-containing protein [Verrucomicrobiae bacterium]|nr:ankyrin repeat domain-containing protein [Verrucomicrobiae bacterium]